MESTGAYRFFGDLFLDDPSSNLFLVQRLKRLQPFIRDLELRQNSFDAWNCQDAFHNAARAEVACWRAYGQERDIRFLIPPHGPLDAPLSCHLHNPNFNVADPYSSCGADSSNLSIHQIMSAGFTPDRVLIYDHTFRREPVDGLTAYPPNLLDIHESFTSDLRRHMAAVVDIVWGAPVRERMKQTHRLEEFQLWGKYRSVSIFFEWEMSGNRLQRFVVFVCHPEAMIYGDPETLGKKQDLHLQVAARLANISIPNNFYEQFYRPKDHKFLSGAELAHRAALNKEAITQLESVAYRSRSTINPDRQRRNRVPHLERQRLRQYPGLHKYFNNINKKELVELDEVIHCTGHGNVKQPAGLSPTYYMHPEVESEFIGPRWLKILASSLVDGDGGNTTATDAMQLCYALADGEFDHSGAVRWEDLPRGLRCWLQEQDGLKVNGRPIASVCDLLGVHGLVMKKPAILEGDLKVSITKIFVEVVTRYYHLIAYAARDSNLEKLIIRGTKPLPLKCSRCKSRLLDDSFPRFKKSEKERYVAHNLKQGCGSNICQVDKKPCLAIPWDAQVPWAAPKKIILERPPMKADWTDALLLPSQSKADLPRIVHIICRACQDQSSIHQDNKPRWTIETTSRYVIRKPRCKICCRNDVTWCPVDKSISWLDPASISKMWKKKEEKNWDVEDMIKNPSKYFPQSREEQRAARRRRTKRVIRYQR
ncbi:hypothetical protein QQS21_009384 [Conoideocrella luteorostrata]|uniref:Uncharacterized protein n=1 Tax=Conoideocrella luteorostrata TaxID=1105319 RepID=A0AAJ0FQC5_9HYPO|nr:hypothetical protein QQS21_009384 [Conoideocrella luteorostrata]